MTDDYDAIHHRPGSSAGAGQAICGFQVGVSAATGNNVVVGIRFAASGGSLEAERIDLRRVWA